MVSETVRSDRYRCNPSVGVLFLDESRGTDDIRS